MLNRAARSAASARLQCRNPSFAAVKKKPRIAGLEVLRGNGGVLFRDFWDLTELASGAVHTVDNTRLDWFVK